ncbi:DUF4398 domain-containing protein [Nitrosococcus wardiae]|uniref:DUF4398 domain-containing protein n=1 Tax=Nitrosococcus wardiae TaxID=1814290 RepID=A0A4P7C0D1_9GAMM|nr:DUF4398 domain-containing protein [Nitrosococcus wardiae]QBQ55029.1 DUF4398 domain-containing protein [Nitrosococcus wardiae]
MSLPQISLKNLLVILVIAAGLWGLSGCASVPPPRKEMAEATLIVSEAQETEAPQYAPVELRTARNKLSAAESAMAEEDYKKARRLAEQALVDAQLAEAKSQAEIQRQQVEELRKSIEMLRRELIERR